MSERIVKDSAGRTWTCTSAPVVLDGTNTQGRDVVVSCATPSVDAPVTLTVGWQWEQMAAPGFARLITQLSPAPRR